MKGADGHCTLGGGCYNSAIMSLILIVKLLVVIIFLVMFLRRPSLPWGVGLLTVSTAVLLDTFLGTFNREALTEQLGFFFYVIAGALMGGSAFWFLSLFWPHLLPTPSTPTTAVTLLPPTAEETAIPLGPVTDSAGVSYDLSMIYQDVQKRFGREDLLDLMFDVEIPETAVMPLNQGLDELSRAIINYAAQNDKVGQLALAVERILTPPVPSNLPRLEKLTAVSPRASLRYYLLAHYNLEKLQRLIGRLGIDGEQLEGGEKRAKVRELLLYLYRRNRVDDLITLMKEDEK